MDRTILISQLRDISEPLRSRGATALYLFGSRARDDYRPDSDVDVLVDYDPAKAFSLLSLAAIQRIASEHLGLEVRATTRSSLGPHMRAVVEREALRVF